jgi:hypothetical protein
MRIARPCALLRASLLSLVALALGLPAAAQMDVNLAGTVMDGTGAPVAGVGVAQLWLRTEEGLRPEHGVVTAADGAFALTRSWSGGSIEVLALDPQGARGGFATWKEGAFDAPATVTLLPHGTLRMNLRMPENLPEPEVLFSLTHEVEPGVYGAGVVARPAAGVLELSLPPGKYTVSFTGPDLEAVGEAATLTAGATSDLGEFQLQSSVLAQYVGRPPPELHVTDARGVSAEVKLARLQGQVGAAGVLGLLVRPLHARQSAAPRRAVREARGQARTLRDPRPARHRREDLRGAGPEAGRGEGEGLEGQGHAFPDPARQHRRVTEELRHPFLPHARAHRPRRERGARRRRCSAGAEARRTLRPRAAQPSCRAFRPLRSSLPRSLLGSSARNSIQRGYL